VIFVTVGTTRFDTLISAVDEAVGRGEIPEEVILQIGYGGDYIPKYCEYFRTAPELDPYYKRASLVIGHGGTGTTLELLELGVRFVSVCNSSLIDNHQDEFLEALESKGMIRYCRDLKLLPALIREALPAPPPKPVNPGSFFGHICADLESYRLTCADT
jgi:beta-1,4-N-acetylglucosaminyltransferase